jgi:hypothetical protein
MYIFAISIFLSAFLLFQVEPMIGKFILPWFGGTPAVWSTLMLLFQVLLTGGYAYAYWLIARMKRQSILHIVLLGIAVLLLGWRGVFAVSPIMPSVSTSMQNFQSPIFEITKLLLGSVSLPFFILAANGPLMQAWFSEIYPTKSYARLYALSNVGSLVGLLTYPVLIEPTLSLRAQGWMWFVGFVVFGLLTGWVAFKRGRAPAPSKPVAASVKSSEFPSFALI